MGWEKMLGTGQAMIPARRAGKTAWVHKHMKVTVKHMDEVAELKLQGYSLLNFQT